MTRDEFIDLPNGCPVILLKDGRMGLCPHWTDIEVLVDVYEGNSSAPTETVSLAFDRIKHLGGGALREVAP